MGLVVHVRHFARHMTIRASCRAGDLRVEGVGPNHIQSLGLPALASYRDNRGLRQCAGVSPERAASPGGYIGASPSPE